MHRQAKLLFSEAPIKTTIFDGVRLADSVLQAARAQYSELLNVGSLQIFGLKKQVKKSLPPPKMGVISIGD